MHRFTVKWLSASGRAILPLGLLLLLAVSCGGDSNSFVMEGNFRGLNQGELYVYGMNGTHPLDTIGFARGEFRYQITLEDTATLILVFPNFSELPVIAEPGATVKINGDATHLKETEVKGTDYNKEMTAFRLQTAQMTPPEFNRSASQYIKDHPDSPVSLYLLNRYFIQAPDADYQQTAQLAELMGKAMPGHPELSALPKKLSGLQTLKKGSRIPAFTVTDINGRTVSSAEMNAKANVILIWASWNYESINVLNRLQSLRQHFDNRVKVLCVSLDANARDSRRILKRDSIQWTAVCDGRMWESPVIQKTGLSHIPDNIVFDSQGKVVAHSLNLDDLLKTLEELIE